MTFSTDFLPFHREYSLVRLHGPEIVAEPIPGVDHDRIQVRDVSAHGAILSSIAVHEED